VGARHLARHEPGRRRQPNSSGSCRGARCWFGSGALSSWPHRGSPVGPVSTPSQKDRPIPVDLQAEVEAWMLDDPDPSTRAELAALLAAGDSGALRARFESPLSFGTAGLRGALGAGPARMNRLVVRKTTAGLARWLLDKGPETARRRPHRRGSGERGGELVRRARRAEWRGLRSR